MARWRRCRAWDKDPGTIQDQRDELIRQLSGLVNVSVTQTEHGLTLTTGNGVPLVVANQSYALQANANNSVLEHVYSAQGQDITSQIQGGQLGRDDTDSRSGASAIVHAAEYPGQPVCQPASTLQHAAGFDASGNAGRIFLLRCRSTTDAAANFGVAITDPSLIAASSDGSAGSNGNLEQLLALRESATSFGRKSDGYVFEPGAAGRQSRRQCAGRRHRQQR